MIINFCHGVFVHFSVDHETVRNFNKNIKIILMALNFKKIKKNGTKPNVI